MVTQGYKDQDLHSYVLGYAKSRVVEMLAELPRLFPAADLSVLFERARAIGLSR